MFIGIDHGTTAMRFAALFPDGNVLKLEIPRTEAAGMTESQLISSIENAFGISSSDIFLMAVTYSMGDGIKDIEDIRTVENRGVKSIEGAGKKTGGGGLVFDSIRSSGIPAVVIPGIHENSDTDPRLNIFSHSTSPEKIGIAYHAFAIGFNDFVLSDISSNTVTVAVSDGKLIGAIDACIFAPGLQHGPLDVQCLRDVDAGKMSANEAFVNSGVLKHTSFSDRHELIKAAADGDSRAILAIDSIALFAAMEITGMQLLMKEYGSVGDVVIEGSVGEVPEVVKKIEAHLDVKAHVLDRWSAAIGCAEIARDINSGSSEILGLKVNFKN
ncbi:methanogenesis marker 12 protein [Methanolobus bombayensis]|uniref:methanogenesis marker 12 protein n=1 Tax=Methanolobus bombayensis TaxID=38023 RepID=UPI001AEA2616|nr:methanogenesis marker 12 protein [Methanolobus bombayensis]MBP1908775.1 putative methanogenesis marker protein 12 [Methanolobus bombayensis]